MRVFLLDNTDSFTYNLAQAFLKLGAEVLVKRAEEMLCSRFEVRGSRFNGNIEHRTWNMEHEWRPTHLVLSPGPLRPADHPANCALLDRFAGKLPILGVCLGMQAINEWCGGTLRRDTPPMHGKTSPVHYEPGAPLLDDMPNPFVAARYHSLVVDRLGDGLRATAWVESTNVCEVRGARCEVRTSDPGPRTPDHAVIMALAHTHWPLYGVQIHPESYLTPEGEILLSAFLRSAGRRAKKVRNLFNTLPAHGSTSSPRAGCMRCALVESAARMVGRQSSDRGS